VLKADAANLTKFRHPSLLNLVEAPLEDKTVIVFITEPVDFNLASLAFDSSLRDRIPSEVDLKCMVLELMECINFLHANAKTIHMNLSPENIYITQEGKLKVGGLNFIQPFTTAEPISVHLDFMSRVRDFNMVPNLRFGSPELTTTSLITAQADIFSIGCIIYFITALSKGRKDSQLYLLNQQDITAKQLHENEVGSLQRRIEQMLGDFDPNLKQIIRQMCYTDPSSRGFLGQYVQNGWF